MKVSQKNKETELSWDTAVLILDIHLTETKIGYQRDNCSPVFSAALFITAKSRKQPICPSTDEWIKKMWHVYTQWNIIQTTKKRKSCYLWQHGWNLRALRQVQLSQRKTDSVQFHVYVESKRAKLMETEYRVVVKRGWRQRRWGDFGQSIRTSSSKMSKFWGCNTRHGEYS